MATTVKLKNSVTTTNAPSSLAQGEVAVNVTDKKVWVGNAATTPVQLLGTGADGTFTNLTVSGTFAANGGATLGDASGDALTINSSAVSIPNGLNFDSNTFVIDATNNRVGVGTASPAYAVDITASGASAYLSTTNGTVQAVYGTSNGASAGLLGTFSNHPQVFWTNNAERMRIDSSGRALIGDTAGTADGKLLVQDTGTYTIGAYNSTAVAANVGSSMLFSGGAGANRLAMVGGYFSGAATTDGGYMNFSTRAVTTGAITERMRLDSSGNLGLGVTPSAWSGVTALEVQAAALYGTSTVTELSNNSYYNGTNYIYKTTGYAQRYRLIRSSGTHEWYTTTSGTAGNAITFTQAMTLNANGNLALQGGTTSATGVGITFPATQSASTDANCLDDYEEGTYTPTIEGGTTAGTGTYSVQVGRYTKIGNIVTVAGRIIWSAHTGTGIMRLTLPFTVKNTANYYPPGSMDYSNFTVGTGKQGVTAVNYNTTYASFDACDPAGGARANISIDTAADIMFSFTYEV